MTAGEGVIRFRLDHRREALPDSLAALAAEIAGWRRALVAAGVVGRDPARYGGFGFGNLSARLAGGEMPDGRRAFLVTGSQTGHLADLDLAGFALVESWDAAGHRLASRGLAAPSSESLTHAALYDASPAIGAVFHVHAPALWARRGTPELPATAPGVDYGTPEMAAEVARLALHLGDSGLLAMSGHDDGLVAWGPTAGATGRRLLAALDT
jgi:ribulose-5-phosphate 4-epimerase/fuculose-1-phosphate aldolase